VAINGVDYLDFANRSLGDVGSFTTRANDFLREFESRLHFPVSLYGTGPTLSDIAIDPSSLRSFGKKYAEILD
jgi:hypothetical protein